MITKKVLEEMLEKNVSEGFDYAVNNLLNEDVDAGVYGYELGRRFGREEVLAELLALLDNANTIHSVV